MILWRTLFGMFIGLAAMAQTRTPAAQTSSGVPKTRREAEAQLTKLRGQLSSLNDKYKQDAGATFESGPKWLDNFFAQIPLITTLSTPQEVQDKKKTFDTALSQAKRGDYANAAKNFVEVGKWAGEKIHTAVKVFKDPASNKTDLIKNLGQNTLINLKLGATFGRDLANTREDAIQLGQLTQQADFLQRILWSLPLDSASNETVPGDPPATPPASPITTPLEAPANANSDTLSSANAATRSLQDQPRGNFSISQLDELDQSISNADLDNLITIERWLDLGDRAFDIAGPPEQQRLARQDFYATFPALSKFQDVAATMSPRSAASEAEAAISEEALMRVTKSPKDWDECIKDYNFFCRNIEFMVSGYARSVNCKNSAPWWTAKDEADCQTENAARARDAAEIIANCRKQLSSCGAKPSGSTLSQPIFPTKTSKP